MIITSREKALRLESELHECVEAAIAEGRGVHAELLTPRLERLQEQLATRQPTVELDAELVESADYLDVRVY